MPLDAIASEIHYLHHLLPVWGQLGPTERGTLYAPRPLARELAASGIEAVAGSPTFKEAPNPVLACAWKDAHTARRIGRPVVLAEHGAGQTYIGVDSPSYIGAPDRDGITLVLAPNEKAADKHRATHPDIPVAVVGCPKLDRLARLGVPDENRVALTHHWDCRLVPETRTAWGHFVSAYSDLARLFPGIIGHAHPRGQRMGETLGHLGYKIRHQFSQVAAEARVLVVDNSSVGAEWLALDKPVVWLNAPWYRRDIHHGGRFWEWAEAGVQVDQPADLTDAIRWSLDDDPKARQRRAIIDDLYVNLGTAAPAAADAIRSHLNL